MKKITLIVNESQLLYIKTALSLLIHEVISGPYVPESYYNSLNRLKDKVGNLLK